MKQEEISFLKLKKRGQGLSEMQIFDDIKNLNNSQFTFKKINSQINKLKTIIENKNKKIELLESKLKKKREKDFKDNFNNLSKTDNSARDFNNLKRMIRYMEKDVGYTKTDLSTELCINPDSVKECLIFLNFIKFIEIKNTEGVVKYIKIKEI